MNHPFGWDLPPGVRLSDPGGPEDPARVAAEVAEERLADGFYLAQKLGFSIKEINEIWAASAEDAYFDEQEERKAEEKMLAEWSEAERQAEEYYGRGV